MIDITDQTMFQQPIPHFPITILKGISSTNDINVFNSPVVFKGDEATLFDVHRLTCAGNESLQGAVYIQLLLM